jgi:hypothetical protein
MYRLTVGNVAKKSTDGAPAPGQFRTLATGSFLAS